MDIARAVSNFRFFAGAVRHDFTECHHMADAFNYSSRSPVGVCGLITPWNLPIYLLSWKVAPALAMGNTIVAKASELTPLSAQALALIVKQVGVPDGVFNLVHGYGWEVGQALVAHPNVPLISFTGGTVTGKKVAATAAPMFKKLSLELGGKNSTIVFADCDFDLAVQGAVRSAFTNQGQVCLAGSRVFVERSIYDRFLEAFLERAKMLSPGNPLDPQTNFGALVSHAHRDKVASYVAIAEQEGGRVALGGKVPELKEPLHSGAFFLPTVIVDAPPSSRVSREEIFGPIVTVHPFDTEDEVVAEANAVAYGLAGSVWTTNLSRAHRVSRNWQTGMVWVNCWLHRDLRAPFGGVKDSGVGREGGRHSLEFYSELKNICIFESP